MFLLVMRHGNADSAGTGSDFDRPISRTGRLDLVSLAQGVSTLEMRPEIIVHSPLVRTRETAEILVAGLGGQVPLLEAPLLSPGASPAEVQGEVSGLANFGSVMVVGHAPDVSEICYFFLAGERGLALQFMPGSVACIEFDEAPEQGRGRVHWLMSQDELGRLGSSSV